MRNFFLITLSIGMFLFMGCTKQESKENLNNINQGFKNAWGDTKKSFNESTKEFSEESKSEESK